MKFWLLCILVTMIGNEALASKEEWQHIKNEYFIVAYRPGVPLDFAQTVLDTAREELKRISSHLGLIQHQNWRSDQRGRIAIYQDEQDYVKNGGLFGWSHGATLISHKMIKTYPQEHGFFDSTLPHELGHIIFREIIGSNSTVPLWFEEGVAMNQEKAKRFGSNKRVKEMLENGEFISLTELSNMRLYKTTDEHAVDNFYAQAASAVSFLISQNSAQKFYNVLKLLKENKPFETALSQTYIRFTSIVDLNKWWINYLKGNE